MKILAAVIATALVTAGAGWGAISTFGLNPGQSIRVEGTNLKCFAYYAQEGNALQCHELGEPTWIGFGPQNLIVTRREKPSTLTTAARIRRLEAVGDLDLATNWASSRQLSSRATADAKTIASLQTQVGNLTVSLSQANGQLQTVKQQLAAAQASVVGALETESVATLMKTTLPQFGTWFSQQGGDFSQFTDPGSGYASYTFQCDSCVPGG
jgi:hypothetical protein